MSSRRQRSIPLGGRYRQVSLYKYISYMLPKIKSYSYAMEYLVHYFHFITYLSSRNGKSETHIWLSLQWSHGERDGVSNHQPHECSDQRRHQSSAQKASNAGNISISWRHHWDGDVSIFESILVMSPCLPRSENTTLVIQWSRDRSSSKD